tara:strand:+ start:1008 stop:1913 length:906 start_codon:yes stop_codon:yes gene_type:complete
MPNLVEHLRELSINRLFNIPSFQTAWNQSWRQEINNQIGTLPTVNSVLGIGDELRNIFRTTAVQGRDQGILAAGGATWEALVCWYMNLCQIGSRSVTIKFTKELIPQCLIDAITVMYGTFPSNTESDLMTIIFPDIDEVRNILPNTSIEHFEEFKLNLDQIVQTNFNDIRLGIIQCKTNWNENAQIPMLWDMIYNVRQFRSQNISVGTNGFSIQDLAEFTYSFVTVPSQNIDYRPNTTPVNRVSNLTGGNFWGQPTVNNVALSLREIFNRNFSAGQYQGLRQDLGNEIQNLTTNYTYFNIP